MGPAKLQSAGEVGGGLTGDSPLVAGCLLLSKNGKREYQV